MSGLTAAVDAGTSLIKAVVLDEEGRELAIASRPTRVLTRAGGRSEQDMSEVLEAVLECLREAARLAPGRIERIAVTAQGDGAWLVDGAGDPLGRAALWNDGRSDEVVEGWSADGTLERAFRINGSLGNLGLPNAILAWTRRHDPGALEGATAVLTCGSWLYLALTGVCGLHPSEASAPWLDMHTGGISEELVELYGLAWARDLIPPVLDAHELTAPLRAEPAEVGGLDPGIPVTLAAYDVVATATGSGAVAVGDAFCILGTTLCTGVRVSTPATSGVPSGLTLLGLPGQAPVRAFPTLAGTGVIDWAVALLGLGGARELTELAATVPVGAGGVRLWPYLSPAGERAPFLDPAARGVIAGLSFETGAAEIARAAIEGLAHVIRDCLDTAGPRPASLSLSGGGAASELWCRTIADVTGVPVVRGDGAQLGARGALVAALVADGSAPDEASALARIATERVVFDPDPPAAALLEARHADFLATRDALAPRWAHWRAATR
ncbi:MAG: carbohydrate kinase [Micrococcales bacterium]|nr:carbohydrate kinase [Micrococcales bacterium]